MNGFDDCLLGCCIRQGLERIVAEMPVSTPEQRAALEEEVAGIAASADNATKETMRSLTEEIGRESRR